MWEYNYSYSNELYHYGVLGMKWGHHKAQYATEKEAYKKASKSSDEAYKTLKKASRKAFGIEGLKNYSKAEKNFYQKRDKAIQAKVKYKTAKAKNSEKAEFNVYRKEMQKSGLVGSAMDRKNGGRSTALYNSITKTKGKEYADRVQKKVQNKLVAEFATAAVLAVGSQAAYIYLNNR